MKNLLMKIVPFVTAFAIVAGGLYWWGGDQRADLPAELSVQPSSLLDFKDDYEDSVEAAKWIFENHQCKSCHSLSEAGLLGLTDQGKEVSQDFQGCPGMLKTVMETVFIPEQQWTERQVTVRADFKRFGCTTCHQVERDGMTLTEMGAKAAVMHLSCSGVMGKLSE